MKNTQVREIREREMNLMKQTRLEIYKLKEVQRSELKEISKRNDERIRKMKEEERKSNHNKALSIKTHQAALLEQKRIEREHS